MSGSIVCRLCGRYIEPRGPGMRRYCRPYKARADRLAAKPPRVQCRECGGRFVPSGSRIVRYCSDTCRKKGYERITRANNAARRGRGAGATGERDDAAPAQCRVCSREIAGSRKRQQLQRQRRRGRLPLHCSVACRAEDTRAYNREYMRRRRADPERLAVMAARSGALRAGRRVEARAACRACGKEFLAASRSYLYCPPCRKKRNAYASSSSSGGGGGAGTTGARGGRSLPRHRPRQAARRGRGAASASAASASAASTTAKCRACSKEFAPAVGRGRRRAYCSNACRAEGRRATVRESKRRSRSNHRLRLGIGKGGRGRGSGAGSDRRGGGDAVKCRVCSKEFAPAVGRGRRRAYCSDACRTEGRRAAGREAARRYRSDPEKRAIQAAARKRAGRASHRRLVSRSRAGEGAG